VGLPKGTDLKNVENLRVGVHTYENFYNNDEMKEMESMIEDTEKKSIDSNIYILNNYINIDAYLPMTAQKTYSGNFLKRTKFFFGFRYMWTRSQL
jgi:hypothetical protein